MDMGLGGLQELVMDREAWRSWGCKESDMTEQLNWTEWTQIHYENSQKTEIEDNFLNLIKNIYKKAL